MAKLIINNMEWFGNNQNPIVNEIIFKLIEDFKPMSINTSLGVEFVKEMTDCSWIYFLVSEDEEIEVQDESSYLSIDVAALHYYKEIEQLTVDNLCDIIVGSGLFSMTADLIIQTILENEEKANFDDVIKLVSTYLKVDLDKYDIIWDNSHENGANFPLFDVN
jgi:predicted Mrr-cat superfamily restriction endonuclease